MIRSPPTPPARDTSGDTGKPIPCLEEADRLCGRWVSWAPWPTWWQSAVSISLTEGYGFQRGHCLSLLQCTSPQPPSPSTILLLGKVWGSFEEWEYCKVTFFQISSIQTNSVSCAWKTEFRPWENGSGLYHLGLTELVTTHTHPSQVKRHHTTVHRKNISLWV